MNCIYCQTRAGLLKRLCPDCAKLVDVANALPPSFGYRELLDSLMATGASTDKIEKFLMTDIDGRGSINDQITARMTNEVMAGLGQPSHMSSLDVKKVRQQIAEGKPPSLVDQEVVNYNQLPHKK